MMLAVAGSRGSFSHEAAVLYCTGQHWPDAEFVYALDSAGAFLALEQQRAEKIILPIYNTTGGLVNMTLAAMGEHLFRIEASFDLSVQQCLLVLPDTAPATITTITSHEQALKQCRRYLQQHWPKRPLVEYSDTAQAAADVASGKLSATTAVIAPQLAAELYHLHVLAKSIQDDKNNTTTFLVIVPPILIPSI